MRKQLFQSLSCITMAAVVALTGVAPSMAAQTDPNASAEREAVNAEISKTAASQGMVLLDNQEGVLPIEKSGKIALYGTGVYATVKGGTGSGDVNLKRGKTWDVLSAFEDADYEIVNRDFLTEIQASSRNGDEGNYEEAKITDAAGETDTAIYVLARNSGEFNDRTATPGDYYLRESEAVNLKLLGEKFEHVIVVLNVGGIVDTNFYHGKNENVTSDDPAWLQKIDGLDALLLMSQAGQEGGHALVEVLNGTVNPSGKLTDTWAIAYEDYSSSAEFSTNDMVPADNSSYPDRADSVGNSLEEIYKDDIYVGYRYFDTFGKEVAYPFGYGGSYTDFDIHVTGVTADAETVTVKADVTNTGTEDGREVVEVYFSAPEGALDKPYQELAGYQKVAVATGETASVTVTFDTEDMSSYDESQDAYIMEDGTYTIRVGNSSRNTVEAASITLDEDVIVEKCRNNLGATRKQLQEGTYTDGSVLNNEYVWTQAPNIWGQMGINIVGVPQYGQKPIEGILDGNAQGYGTGITPTAEGLTAEDSAVSLHKTDFAEAETHTYQNGDITTYVSTNSAKDSAKYAKDREENKPDVKVKGTEKIETVGAVRNATLVDVVLGNITMEQLVADMSKLELADFVEGGTYRTDSLGGDNGTGSIIGAAADSVRGAAGETTSNMYTSRFIPNIVLSDGPAGIRITTQYTVNERYEQVAADEEYNAEETYYEQVQGWWGPSYNVVQIENREQFNEKKETGLYRRRNDGTYYQYCTAFPVGTLMAQTWDTELIETVGRAIGTEMLEYGVTSWLAPSMNIHRNPLCGRNFEYYSEDPLIAGLTAAAATKGVQTDEDGNYTGIGVTLKHFALNNQENDRMGTNSVVSERAAREIYLKGFEIGVKEGRPDYVMTSYNMINGYSAFLNYGLVTEILRNEWGFDGFVMTDWYSADYVNGKNSTDGRDIRALLMYAGNDCEMPGSPLSGNSNGNTDALLEELEHGVDIRLGDLQRSAMNMLNVIMRSRVFRNLTDTLRKEYPDLEKSFRDKETMEQLYGQVAETEKKLEEAIEAANQAKADKDAADQAVKDAQKALDDANEAIKKAQEDLEDANADKDEVQKALDQANAAKDEAQRELDRANAAKDEAQRELDRANAAKDEVQKELDQVNAAKDQAQNELNQANADKNNTQNALDQANTALKKAQDDLKALQAQVSAAPQISVGKVVQNKPVSRKKKQMQISWKASEGVTGYEVQYAQKKNMKNAVTKTVKGSKTKLTVKKLKSKKNYFVRVRAYTVTGDMTVYGAFSGIKRVKIK